MESIRINAVSGDCLISRVIIDLSAYVVWPGNMWKRWEVCMDYPRTCSWRHPCHSHLPRSQGSHWSRSRSRPIRSLRSRSYNWAWTLPIGPSHVHRFSTPSIRGVPPSIRGVSCANIVLGLTRTSDWHLRSQLIGKIRHPVTMLDNATIRWSTTYQHPSYK